MVSGNKTEIIESSENTERKGLITDRSDNALNEIQQYTYPTHRKNQNSWLNMPVPLLIEDEKEENQLTENNVE